MSSLAEVLTAAQLDLVDGAIGNLYDASVLILQAVQEAKEKAPGFIGFVQGTIDGVASEALELTDSLSLEALSRAGELARLNDLLGRGIDVFQHSHLCITAQLPAIKDVADIRAAREFLRESVENGTLILPSSSAGGR